MKRSLSELVVCSEKEMTSCSLQVLSPTGSPGRFLLAMLVDRSCPLGFLLHCLKKMDHQDAVQYLTTTGTHTRTHTHTLIPTDPRCSPALRCFSWGPPPNDCNVGQNY